MDEVMRVRKRLTELYKRSFQNNQYCFTDFLSAADLSELMNLIRAGEISGRYVTMSGGYDGAERQMVRFGSEEEFGWSEEFPITILKIAPLMEKFGENLSHRDYLGSLMALNVDRDTIGDIRIVGKSAWIFVVDRMAEFLTDHLDEVRHTHVKVERVEALPADADVHLEEMELILPSERVDVIVAKLVNSSRAKTLEYFRTGKIFVNGRLMENNSGMLKAGDVISIRGYGKVIYDGVRGRTRKDHIVVLLRRYV